jgi:catechol 2,3-dioxygenase-like lactoylglutathione lyase family enzyme
MSASQEQQPTLDSVAPRFLVRDMEQALAFYGQLGFATPYHDEGFVMLERDGVALHFNVSDPTHDPPQEGCRVCSIGVTISRRCISSMCQLALFGLLSRRHPGGRKDFGSAIPFALS